MLDRYFGNVCELDLVFNFHKAYTVSVTHILMWGGQTITFFFSHTHSLTPYIPIFSLFTDFG